MSIQSSSFIGKLVSLVSIILFMVSPHHVTLSEDIVITSPVVTDWGDWGPVELCPTGTYVYGMRLKTESGQGIFEDDSALNAVELLCLSPTVRRNSTQFQAKNPITRAFASVKSSEGEFGAWGHVYECVDPEFAKGFELMSEPDQGWSYDDSAANNFKLICTSGMELTGDGLAFGFWTGPQNCPRGLKVCGIQTQVEGPNSDDTSLNNINLACCQ